jgi:IclR family transcriptional regulator, pca regulon regulatory protein
MPKGKKPMRTTAAKGHTDFLMVNSVAKAFRVLEAFDPKHASMSLSQVAKAARLDMSAAQRFTHTLTKIGYLRKDPETKAFELTARTLALGHNYTRASTIIERALPYLMHLSRTTEETVNLTVRDDTDIVFVARFMSRHILNNDVMIGTRMPAYCTAPGVAILSRMSRDAACDVLSRSKLRAYTPSTIWKIDKLIAKLDASAARGYATAFEEFYHGDLSIAAAVVNSKDEPICALNIAVLRARFTPKDAEKHFAPLVVAAAQSISKGLPHNLVSDPVKPGT